MVMDFVRNENDKAQLRMRMRNADVLKSNATVSVQTIIFKLSAPALVTKDVVTGAVGAASPHFMEVGHCPSQLSGENGE